MTNEPVSVFAAINAAVVATLAILMFAGVDPDLVGAITLAATAWIGVAAVVVRSRVTPTAPRPERDAGRIDLYDLIVIAAVVVLVWFVLVVI